jgi:GPI-anchor transamidase subunit K
VPFAILLALDARDRDIAGGAQIFNDRGHATNLYTDTMEVDYRNYDVTLSNIIRVLTDRHPTGTARSRRLLSDGRSNVLLYITGHGGNEFMKIQAR